MNLEKVCIVAGAGAEIPLGVSGGEKFASAVLGLHCQEMNDAIKEFYTKLKLLNDWYPQYVSYPFNSEDLLKSAIKKEILETGNFSYKKNYDDELEKIYNQIKDDESIRIQKIEKYSSYMGILDEQFHTLIKPKALGPKKFWSVVDCYTRAYLFLINKICYNKELSKDEYIHILENPHETMTRMKEIAKRKYNEKNYYSILREADIEPLIVTTNYTPLCPIISDIDMDHIAYIHGRFGLFENPRTLQILDIEKDELTLGEDIFFPYIFIQSGIKPIVDRVQIKEYSKMISFFERADKIIIVGYRLNFDDNHINSILRSFIYDKKEIIYLDYDEGSTLQNILEKMQIPSSDDIKNFHWYKITKENAYSIFEGVIK